MPTLTAERVAAVLRQGASARMVAAGPARFGVGDPVLVRNRHPEGHTRNPRYLRGRRGVVERDQGAFIFPDEHSASGNKVAQRLYSVRFTATELWGPDARSPNDCVYVDLFESYLDAALD